LTGALDQNPWWSDSKLSLFQNQEGPL
jgi:hypothetical protein